MYGLAVSSSAEPRLVFFLLALLLDWLAFGGGDISNGEIKLDVLDVLGMALSWLRRISTALGFLVRHVIVTCLPVLLEAT